MGMNTTLQRWGNSQGIRIPKKIIKSLGAEIGTKLTVEISPDYSQITVKPVQDNRPVRGRHRIVSIQVS